MDFSPERKFGSSTFLVKLPPLSSSGVEGKYPPLPTLAEGVVPPFPPLFSETFDPSRLAFPPKRGQERFFPSKEWDPLFLSSSFAFYFFFEGPYDLGSFLSPARKIYSLPIVKEPFSPFCFPPSSIQPPLGVPSLQSVCWDVFFFRLEHLLFFNHPLFLTSGGAPSPSILEARESSSARTF